MQRRISLIVTTYEWPEALNLVLASVAAQTTPPHEVIVCDDGSGATTRATIERWRERLMCDLRHVWQPNEGFRAARVRNLGIAAATGEYVTVVDGDMVLDRHYVEDHGRAARLGQWVQGVRPRLSQSTTRALLQSGRPDVAWWRGAMEHRWHGVRSALLSKLDSRRNPRLASIKSCNQGYWRADLVRANGFDERFVGWGPEDKELAARLAHAGLECVYLKHLAIAYHLWHPTRAPSGQNPNDRLLEETLRTRATRAPVGLDVHGIAA